MNGPVVDLVQWLREQIADRQQRAEAAGGDRWYQDGKTGEIIATNGKTAENCAGGYWTGIAEHIEANDPRDVLAQCEAHTAILELHEHYVTHAKAAPAAIACRVCDYAGPYDDVFGELNGWCATVRATALAYQHNDGYDERWRP